MGDSALTPLVSIVVPVFNCEKFIKESVDSLLTQSYSRLEVIVVDDGSDDATPQLLEAFGSSICCIRQDNRGQSAALTTGWSVARGELIGYLSADDRLLPGAIQALALALVQRPNCALVYPNFRVIGETSEVVGVNHLQLFDRRTLYRDLVCLPGPGALFRRSAYLGAGPWNDTYHLIPDLEFYLRLGLYGDFFHLDQTLADFRRHPGSTTYRPTSNDRADEPLRMVEEFFDRTDLPADIARWRRSAKSSAFLLAALMHAKAGRRGSALQKFVAAAALSPRALASKRALATAMALLEKKQI